eukprot:TRINITY_DN3860_c0_g1_i2.p2 TRINITY_DN3860_c0_g1~~TRINITY_DN3860_c0_g1_i2.p2  ORF type:complete len:137 (-),score=4.60 TRINITY_DN3860_c0_g1_i2:28-438(-)
MPRRCLCTMQYVFACCLAPSEADYCISVCVTACEINSDCLSCLSTTSCGWGPLDNTCKPSNGGGCVLETDAKSCVPKPAFDGTSFVGGMFLVIGMVLAGLGIYRLCIWRTHGLASAPNTRFHVTKVASEDSESSNM